MPLEYRQKSELTIAGKCEEKDLYLKLIEKEERIRVRFERIEDAEIPELFSLHDFLVLPYENVAQSGPHMIAYNYNMPVIASNIDGFKERIINMEDGYLFEVNNEHSLCTVLMKAIDNYGEYDQMVTKLKSVVKKKFSNEVITRKYKLYLDKIIECNEKH